MILFLLEVWNVLARLIIDVSLPNHPICVTNYHGINLQSSMNRQSPKDPSLGVEQSSKEYVVRPLLLTF